MLCKLILVLTCVAFAACTRNQEPSATQSESPARAQTPPAAQTPPPQDTRPILVVFGDSLSEMWSDQGRSFPDDLQKLLDANGYKYRVVNQGISGDTTTGGLGRVNAAIQLKPELVLLELGGNDGLRGVPVADSKQNLEKMIAAFKAAGIRVALAGVTLPPNYGADYIRSFEGMYRDVAARNQLPMIRMLLDLARGLPEHPDWMSPDGIHPSPKGDEVVAATVYRGLAPLLHK